MKEKFYVVAVDDVGFGHGDELLLIRLNDGMIIGYSSEFDVCTNDLVNACSNSGLVKWFGWDDSWEFKAASLDEIKKIGLDQYLIGSKKDMKASTEIDDL